MEEKNYLTSGKFITFLWKPKKFFTEVQHQPIVIVPALMISLLTLLPLLFGGSEELAWMSLQSLVITLLLSSVYFYLFYFFMKNKQSFLLILSIVFHARLASIYLSFIVQFLGNFVAAGSIAWIGFNLISSLSFLLYLGLGIKWGIAGTNKQFLIVFISYIIIVLLLFIAMILLIAWLITSLIDGLSDIFCQTLGFLFDC